MSAPPRAAASGAGASGLTTGTNLTDAGIGDDRLGTCDRIGGNGAMQS